MNTPTGKTYVGSDELYADVQHTMRLCAVYRKRRLRCSLFFFV